MTENNPRGKRPVFLKEHPLGLVLNLFIQPRASQNKVDGIHGEALKIKLTAPPVEGAANKMCREFLAGLFKIPKTAVSIISGETGRNKRVLIECDEETMLRIREFLNKA
jgi:uncharacterized protein